MTNPIFILNGPNLNRLGTREPQIYGSTTLVQVEEMCHARAKTLGLTVRFLQSNHEGQLVDWIHEAIDGGCGIIINPAGYTNTSIAILDALKMFPGPSIEVHISNIHKREEYRHRSFISFAATGTIAGLGIHGYLLAIDAVKDLLAKSKA